MAVAEPEFAFKIGTEIKPNNSYYKVKEVMELVETLHLAIELPDSRFNNFSSVGELSLIADNACADQFVFSKPVDIDWKDIAESAPAVLAMITMPLTYSISNGIALAFISYALI